MENKPFIVKLAKNLLFSSTNSPLEENIVYSRNKPSYFNYYSPTEINEIIDVFLFYFFIEFFHSIFSFNFDFFNISQE